MDLFALGKICDRVPSTCVSFLPMMTKAKRKLRAAMKLPTHWEIIEAVNGTCLELHRQLRKVTPVLISPLVIGCLLIARRGKLILLPPHIFLWSSGNKPIKSTRPICPGRQARVLLARVVVAEAEEVEVGEAALITAETVAVCPPGVAQHGRELAILLHQSASVLFLRTKDNIQIHKNRRRSMPTLVLEAAVSPFNMKLSWPSISGRIPPLGAHISQLLTGFYMYLRTLPRLHSTLRSNFLSISNQPVFLYLQEHLPVSATIWRRSLRQKVSENRFIFQFVGRETDDSHAQVPQKGSFSAACSRQSSQSKRHRNDLSTSILKLYLRLALYSPQGLKRMEVKNPYQVFPSPSRRHSVNFAMEAA